MHRFAALAAGGVVAAAFLSALGLQTHSSAAGARPGPPVTTSRPSVSAPRLLSAGSTRPRSGPPGRTAPRPGTLFLGDSVMLGARPWLRRLPGRVDAVESRQVYQGISIVRRLARAGRLPGRLVVGLGTNGQFPSYVCGDLRRALGPQGRLYLLTVRVARPWTAADNHAITSCARHYRNVSLVPWRAFSGSHPAVFAPDGYHLSARGGRLYAQLIRDSL